MFLGKLELERSILFIGFLLEQLLKCSSRHDSKPTLASSVIMDTADKSAKSG